MPTHNFVPTTGGWNYVGHTRDFDTTVADFKAMLEDFPEPTYKWLDERLPYENHGPGTWTLELQNDHLTTFTFNTNSLNSSELHTLMSELELVVTSDYEYFNLGDDAYAQRVWQSIVTFDVLDNTHVLCVALRVFWRVCD